LTIASIVGTAVLAALYIWAFSRPHSPLEYMVAGTLITTMALGAAFVLLFGQLQARKARVVRETGDPGQSDTGDPPDHA
jgi:hypothetical protein